MAEKKDAKTRKPNPASELVDVLLIADHEDGGVKYKKDDKIKVRKSQVKWLKEQGRIK